MLCQGCDGHYFIPTGISTPSFPTQPALLLLGTPWGTSERNVQVLPKECARRADLHSLVAQARNRKWIVTIKWVDRIYISYLARCFNGGFFLKKNIGFILLPLNYNVDGRNLLNTQEHCMSTLAPSYSSPSSAPSGACCGPRLHVGTPPTGTTIAPRPQQLLEGDRNSNDKDIIES